MWKTLKAFIQMKNAFKMAKSFIPIITIYCQTGAVCADANISHSWRNNSEKSKQNAMSYSSMYIDIYTEKSLDHVFIPWN